ncbi:undecaprenyl diphosphate synthase family protein [Kitasatospora mediocidica]|uniref:hypothetical protein n=1 Tax=Kitasatospora mediocidica TaxID=58352 RepID=UPI000B2B51F4|nr:hypothetical protein [Kitasatospora mediocidica]
MTSMLERQMREKRRAAQDALDRLIALLGEAGIVFPSATVNWRAPVTGIVLIELGAARVDAIEMLIETLRKGLGYADQ